MLNTVIQKIINRLIAICALLLLLPFYILISITLKIESQKPILFKQVSVGYQKSPFIVYNFETIRIAAPPNSPACNLNNSHFCIAGVSGLLRKTSLCKIPQILDVLKADKSIIGPRPLVWNETEFIIERDNRAMYNKIFPGITGLVQIKGRDAEDVNQKAEYDSICAKNICLH